jgi:hypothetical protein
MPSRRPSISFAAACVLMVAVVAVGLWWHFGAGVHRQQFTVASTDYAAFAGEHQNWQVTTTDGTRYYTNAVDYARLHAGQRVSCLVHGRAVRLPVLADHLQSVNLCHGA